MKTLKDIHLQRYGDPMGLSTKLETELRQAAIEWVKEFEKYPSYGCPEEYNDFQDGEYGGFDEVIKWIKHFFNITEEEIK